MNIGVIGVGHIGGTLAEKFVKAGHQVSVANSRGKEAVRAFAEKIGAAPSDISEIVKGKDVVILAVPLPAIEKLPRDLFKDAGKTIVVDTSNYYPDLRDSHIKELDEGKTESLWVSEKIGHPIIKAFNNVLGGIPWQRRAERKGTREDLPPLRQETVRKTKPSSCA